MVKGFYSWTIVAKLSILHIEGGPGQNSVLVTGSTSQQSIVGNKANERNSKRVFQENKSRQIFRKATIFYLFLPYTDDMIFSLSI